MNLGAGAHLTYCTNIHPGETWDEVRANLERFVPAVRDRVAPGARFGIGLRLSAQAVDALSAPAALAELRALLARHNLYVFTLNAFPYGRFHDAAVKEAVYLPDWRDTERLRYTNAAAGLLAELLPKASGMEGSVSTVPGAYKAALDGSEDIARMRDQFVDHAAYLVELERRTGRRITLAIEPEPCCFLETIAECVAFFEQYLFGAAAIRRLCECTALDPTAAAAALRTHLGLCLDLCHAAVEFEDPLDCLQRLARAGIRVLKMQISAGLRITRLESAAVEALRAYQDSVYLHQVIERGPQGLRRFADLDAAFASLGAGSIEREWRVHFHVPIFNDRLGLFHSTRDFIETVLAVQRRRPFTRHLEVETYTWNVLPESLKVGSVEQAIARELEWVVQELRP